MIAAQKQPGRFGTEYAPEGAPAIPLWIGGHAYLTMPAAGFFDLRAADGATLLRRVPLCNGDAVEAAVAAATEALSVAWPREACEAVSMRLAELAQRLAEHLGGFLRAECGATFPVEHELAAFAAQFAPAAAAPDRTDRPLLRAVFAADGAPLAAIAAAVMPALAQGDAVIVKPALRCPSAALAFAEMATLAGLPDGRFNVVHGDDAAIDALCRHPRIDALVCAGSGDAADGLLARLRSAGKPLARSAA